MVVTKVIRYIKNWYANINIIGITKNITNLTPESVPALAIKRQIANSPFSRSRNDVGIPEVLPAVMP